VTLPTPSDDLEALAPHGGPPSGYGDRAWLLRTVIANVRPARWTEWLQVDAAGLIDRAIRSDEARPLLEGWIHATRAFADVGWATALLRDPAVRTKIMVNVALVLERLSPDDQAIAVVDAAEGMTPSDLADLARSVPPPWPGKLVDAVLSAAAALGSEPIAHPALSGLVRAAATGLPPERADDLETVASVNGETRPALIDHIDTIRLRARMHEAFAAGGARPAMRETR
jgi:hypothetical protein